MNKDLFVYGLLQHEAVLQPLIGYIPRITEAVLSDHTRRTLRHPDFDPCAVAVFEAGQSIKGAILHDITPTAMKHLDVFEYVSDGLYNRQQLVAHCLLGQAYTCDVYLKGQALQEENLGDYWCQAEYNEKHLQYMLENVIPKYANY